MSVIIITRIEQIMKCSFLYIKIKAAAEDDVDVAEPLFMIDNSKFEMVNSRYAMTTICNVLMNLTVLEPQFVNETPIFFHILKFIMNSLPTLDNNGKMRYFYFPLTAANCVVESDFVTIKLYLKLTSKCIITDDLVLYGNLSVLGLLILKNHSRRPKSTDFGLCRYIQAIVR